MSQKPADKRPENNSSPIDPIEMAKDEVLGARQWKRSKWGYFTGVGAITDGVKSLSSEGNGAFDRVRALSTWSFARNNTGKAVSEDIGSAEDRFVSAMSINGKNDKDIADSILTTYRQFLFYSVLMGLTIVLGVGSFLFYGVTVPQFILVDILFRFIPVPVLGALMIRSAYTNWLFRRRSLLSIGLFFNASDKMPRKRIASHKRGRSTSTGVARTLVVAFLALTLGTSFFLPGSTLAQDAVGDYRSTAQQIFDDPNNTDLFVQVLSILVPGVGPIPDSEIAPENVYFQATKAAFMTFSGTLLFLGSAIAGWQIISGVVASAKEGRVLGQAYHEVWAPARMVIGFGMLAPIAGGLCAAQIVVLYLIVFGGNLANVVWKPYIETITMTGNMSEEAGEAAAATLSSTTLSLANNTLKEILSKELCYHSLKTYLDSINVWDNGNFLDLRRSWIVKDPFWDEWNAWNHDVTLLWRDETVYGYDYGSACGTLTVRVVADSSTDMEQHVNHEVSSTQLEQVKAIQSALRGGGADRPSYMSLIANSYISRDIPAEQSRFFREGVDHSSFINDLNVLRTNYVRAINDKVKSVYTSTEENGGAATLNGIRDAALNRGWAAAGEFYLTLSRVQNSVYAAAGSGARFSASYISGFGPSTEAAGLLAGTSQSPGIIPSFGSWWDRNIRKITQDSTAVSSMSEMSDNGWAWMNTFFMPVLSIFRWDEGVNPLNPMQHMIEFGNRLMFTGSTTYMAIAGAELLATAPGEAVKDSGVPGVSAVGSLINSVVGSTVGAVAGIAKILALAIIAAGAVHAYILPMIPYVMTVFFVGGMVILTVEALVAAPIWAFFHIRMDGQDFISDVQKPGYMIAFNLLLRPALMVFGLILSYLVFGGMAWFVEATFFNVAESMAASMGVGPIGLLVMIVMVTYIHYQLAIRAFSLITQVPDRVSRWFGQGGEHLGEEDDSNKTSMLLVNQSTSRIEGLARVGGAVSALNRSPGGGVRDRKSIPKPNGDTGEGSSASKESGKPES